MESCSRNQWVIKWLQPFLFFLTLHYFPCPLLYFILCRNLSEANIFTSHSSQVHLPLKRSGDTGIAKEGGKTQINRNRLVKILVNSQARSHFSGFLHGNLSRHLHATVAVSGLSVTLPCCDWDINLIHVYTVPRVWRLAVNHTELGPALTPAAAHHLNPSSGSRSQSSPVDRLPHRRE